MDSSSSALRDRNLTESGGFGNRFAGSEMPRKLGTIQAIRRAERLNLR
jgi:hypothetical protein